MSSRSSSPNPKPSAPSAPSTPDVYVGLLSVAVAALIGGIIFLILELNKYDWQVVAQ
jgi:hypothetical protein